MLFNITKDLNFKTTLGEDFNYTEEHIYYSADHPYGNKVGKLIDGRKSYASTLWENVLTYKHSFAEDFVSGRDAGTLHTKGRNFFGCPNGYWIPLSFF